MKKCSACLKNLNLSKFYKYGKRLLPDCKKCATKRSLLYYHKHRGERKSYRLSVKYGITLLMLEEMYRKRRGKCDVCKEKLALSTTGASGLVLDHAEKNGIKTVRGLLCGDCNTSLGKLGDTYEGVMRAVKYLEPW